MSLRYSLILIVCPLFAQLDGLTTTFDGSVLYASTPWRPRGLDVHRFPKIIRWTPAEGFTVAAIRPRPELRSRFMLESPRISSDGTILSYTATDECYGFTSGQIQSCFFREQYEGVVRQLDGRETTIGEGFGHMSANGRFMALHRLAGFTSGQPRLADLERGTTTNIGESVCRPGDAVRAADDGSVLILCGPVTLWRKGIIERLTDHESKIGDISGDGRIAAYWRNSSGRLTVLASIDTVSRRTHDLFVEDSTPFSPPSVALSSDGSLIVFAARDRASAPRQWLFSIHSDGSEPTWFAFASEGYRSVTLSGDGRVAFASTESGRLIRVEMVTGDVTELLPNTPWIRSITGATVAGSLNRFGGGGFAPDDRVFLDGVELAVVASNPEEVTAQIPWEAAIGITPLDRRRVTAIIERSVGSFESGAFRFTSFSVSATEPPGAIHADGSPVTTINPARGGETLRLFFTGLGAVSPPVPTGQPAPEEPRSWINLPFECVVGIAPLNTVIYTDVYFGGLSPGLIGVHEIELKIPTIFPNETISTTLIQVSCPIVGRTVANATLPYRPRIATSPLP